MLAESCVASVITTTRVRHSVSIGCLVTMKTSFGVVKAAPKTTQQADSSALHESVVRHTSELARSLSWRCRLRNSLCIPNTRIPWAAALVPTRRRRKLCSRQSGITRPQDCATRRFRSVDTTTSGRMNRGSNSRSGSMATSRAGWARLRRRPARWRCETAPRSAARGSGGGTRPGLSTRGAPGARSLQVPPEARSAPGLLRARSAPSTPSGRRTRPSSRPEQSRSRRREVPNPQRRETLLSR